METLKKFIDFGLEVFRTAYTVTTWTVCKILFIKQCKCDNDCNCKNNG